MGLSKEIFRPAETGIAFSNANLGSSEIKVSKLTTTSDGSESRVAELLRLVLGEKDKAGHAEEPKLKRQDGFEPFINGGENDKNNLFVNLYGGDFSQKMELNRKGVEGVLKIAHLEGQVFLTSLSPSRQRSMDGVNPDGSVAAKKKLMLGEEIDDSQKKINPPYRTVPTKDGWRIEINDGKIMEDLNEKKLTGEKRQKTFIKKFSQLLNKSLFECIRKEKMTGIKDKYFTWKAYSVVINHGIALSIWAPKLLQLDLSAITLFISGLFVANTINNLLGLHRKRRIEYRETFLRVLESNANTNDSAYMPRKLDAAWEYFMPQVEIDKVARAWTFLSLKGRKLVREAKPEIK